MLISGSQPELKEDAICCRGRWKYANILDNSQSRFHIKKLCNKCCLMRYQFYEGLEKFFVTADRRRLKLSYSLFSRHSCFYDFQKTNGRFWVLACYGMHWSRTVDHRCCSFLRCSWFCNFTFTDNSKPRKQLSECS